MLSAGKEMCPQVQGTDERHSNSTLGSCQQYPMSKSQEDVSYMKGLGKKLRTEYLHVEKHSEPLDGYLDVA